MKLESVRELKDTLRESVIVPLTSSATTKSALGPAAQPLATAGAVYQPPTMALGVTRKGPGDYALAVRVQRRGLENSPQMDTIRKQAKSELDIRYIGVPSKLPASAIPDRQQRTRPLKIGLSIGHHKITAGTLGAFVRSPGDNAAMVLSNNHVLANENRAKPGDAILQPGAWDEGHDPDDRIAALTRFVRLKRTGANLVDAAVATLEPRIEHDAHTIPGLRGKLAGIGDPVLDEQQAVSKAGRTTGTTRGRVVTFELDELLIAFGANLLRFDQQIEIEGDADEPFSQAGDSGSLIVDADRRAVALLFAGTDQGGANQKGLTYANPLRAVLAALKVELIVS